jgi:hypothetical protein
MDRPADPRRWLAALTPEAATDMRHIIEAGDGAGRADAVRIARDYGLSWDKHHHRTHAERPPTADRTDAAELGRLSTRILRKR